MYFTFFNGRLLALSMLCAFYSVAYTQVRQPFTHLDLSVVGGGFFFPQSHNTVHIPNPYSDTASLSPSQCASLFMSMGRASLDSTHVLSDFSGFRERKDSVAHSEGNFAIALLDVLYYDFEANALTDSLIYRAYGHFYHTEGCQQGPCRQDEAFVVWVDAPTIEQKIYRFVLPTDAVITNYPEEASEILIDFDDGLGWRVLTTNQTYLVDYSAEGRDRNVRCSITRPNRLAKYFTSVLKFTEEFDVCGSSLFPYPESPPWSSNADSPWDISVVADGQVTSGRAYTLKSDDGVFDKPFIFVEGIDFGLDRDGHLIHEQYRHGTFGWCEFSSGFQDPNVNDDMEYGYDNLRLMPQLLASLRGRGYDIVFVDFYDGATWLQHNSELVQQVIRLCNQYKMGQESIVVTGASMGGVITRHALRTMELNGEDHCARLWVSLDAPHEGAHIPLALQHAIRFNIDHGQERAQLFRDRYLLRPAARQMLDAQLFHSSIDFDSWYESVRMLGYPQKCRSLAVSNGMASGEGLNYNNPELMNWECDILGLVHSKLLLLPESGDPYNANSFSGYPLMAHFRSLVLGADAFGDEWFFWLGGLPLGTIDVIDIDEEFIYTLDGTQNRDYAPGGKRNTIQTFASAVNASLAEVEANYNLDLCESVTPIQYNGDHAFVLSSSAVGLLVDDPYEDLNQYILEHAEEMPFDRFYFAQDYNEDHTELTEANLAVVEEEVFGFDLATLDTSLTQQSLNQGVFNYGRPEFPYIRSVHVHHNGKLMVNALLPTHFNEPGDYLSQEYHFEANSLDCSPAVVVVDQQGEIHLGDPSEEYRTAEVVIGRDSRLVIGALGKLWIHPGSSLVIEEGGILEVLPGGKLECTSGNIIIRAGAICSFHGVEGQHYIHEVTLSGNEARWLVDGGQVHIDVSTRVSMNQNVEQTGYMEVATGTENMLHMQVNSSFYWQGKGMDDEILRIVNGAHLQNANWALGSIELRDGRVDLTYNGAIYTDAVFKATNVHFFASDLWEAEGSEVWVWSNACTLLECRFEHVELHTQNSKCIVSASKFYGPNSGYDGFGGAFIFSQNQFKNCDAISNELEMPSVYLGCVFTTNSHLWDWSQQLLKVSQCSFSNTNESTVVKQEGELSLECNHFEECAGIEVLQARLDMSTLLNGGGNSFQSVTNCVRLTDAVSFEINKGFNDFSGCTGVVFQGTIDTACMFLDCEMQWPAHYNHWGFSTGGISSAAGLEFPPSDFMHLYASQEATCPGYEVAQLCSILPVDASPVEPASCEQLAKSSDASATPQNTAVASSKLRDQFDKQAIVRVYDLGGRVVGQYELQVGQSLRNTVADLAMGLYVVRVDLGLDPIIQRAVLGH